MSAFLRVPGCFALGAWFGRRQWLPAQAHLAFNGWVLYIALPALVLHLIPGVVVDAGLWYPVVSHWGVVLGGWAVFSLVGAWLGGSRTRIGCLTRVCGLGNTSFVGYPLLEGLRGVEGLALGMVAHSGRAGFGGATQAVSQIRAAIRPQTPSRRCE